MRAAQADLDIQKQRRTFEQGRLETLLGMDMAQVTGEQQARLQSEQNRKTAGSQLLGTGLNVLGDFAPEIIGALSNSPNTSTPTQFADMSSATIDTSGLGQNLSLTTPSSGLLN